MAVTEPPLDFAAVCAPAADLGVFETLLVIDGRPHLASRHLARLRASVRVLYGAALPAGLGAALAEAAEGHSLARLRVKALPHGASPPAIEIEIAPLDRAAVLPVADVTLMAVRVRGGAGAHKLIDRSWFEQIEGLAGAGVRPLLVNRSDELLETTRANVFLLRDGVLATPPLDGSILPGVVRAAVLEHARRLGIDARELPLTLAQLREADVVLLSGSLALLARAQVRAGRRSAAVADRLAGELAATVWL
jgi:para-aminobenzoate synthetase/4-amino-4-deoxychorismate lyase